MGVRTIYYYAVPECSDHYTVSDIAAAIIAISVLEEFGIVTSNNTFYLTYKELRKEGIHFRSSFERQLNNSKILSPYFDGRKDKTMRQERRCFEEDWRVSKTYG